jgi:hypothetical protein
LGTDRWLTQAQFGRRLGDAALPRHDPEIKEMMVIQPLHIIDLVNEY